MTTDGKSMFRKRFFNLKTQKLNDGGVWVNPVKHAQVCDENMIEAD